MANLKKLLLFYSLLISNFTYAISDSDFEIFEFSNSSYMKELNLFISRNPELIETYDLILSADFNTINFLDKLTSNKDLLREFEDYSLYSPIISELKLYEFLINNQNGKLSLEDKNIVNLIHAYDSFDAEKCESYSDNDYILADFKKEIAYVTQTTLSVDDTKDIVKEIKKHFINVIEPKKNDICYATTNRQEAVKKVAANCDYFLVIGASNSSNSLRLVEVAKNYGSKKAILVEDVDSLNLNIFDDTKNIGITASASSPEILVKKLIDKLKNNFDLHINEAHYQKEDVYFKVPQKLKS